MKPHVNMASEMITKTNRVALTSYVFLVEKLSFFRKKTRSNRFTRFFTSSGSITAFYLQKNCRIRGEKKNRLKI
jgi:hypothetical protein